MYEVKFAIEFNIPLLILKSLFVIKKGNILINFSKYLFITGNSSLKSGYTILIVIILLVKIDIKVKEIIIELEKGRTFFPS